MGKAPPAKQASKNKSPTAVKIALVSTGLGNVWRGYEHYTRDLFDLLKEDLDITLFKGGGETNRRERKFPHLRHDGILSKLTLLPKDPYFYQQLSYALFLIPHLTFKGYTLFHYSEPGLGNILYHVKRKLGFRVTLLFSNGVGLPPEHCLRADFLHQLTDVYYNEAIQYGIPKARVSCLPYGVHSEKFLPKKDKASLRGKHGIPQDKIVVLSVAALNRTHKRMDYLINELAKLDSNFFLLVCGNLEDPSLLEEAEKRIPGRYKFMTVPFELTPEIYNLADIFVHTALVEGFGLALVEAMMAKLPVLAHSSAHFKWLLGCEDFLIDMSKSEHLADKLKCLAEKLPESKSLVEKLQQSAVRRFAWKNLKGRYLAMYEAASKLAGKSVK